MTLLAYLCALFLVPAALLEGYPVVCVLAEAAWDVVRAQSQSYGK